MRVSRLRVDGVLAFGLVLEGGERMLLSVVICDVRDARVGRIGADEVGVVVERPRLDSRAVRRSDSVASDDRVDGCADGSDGDGS